MSPPANQKLWPIPLFKSMKVWGWFQRTVMHVLSLKLEFLYPVWVKIASSSLQSRTMERKLPLCVLLTCGCQMVSFFKFRHPSCLCITTSISAFIRNKLLYKLCSHALYSHAKIFLMHLEMYLVFYKVLLQVLETLMKSRRLKLKSRQ